MTQKKSSLPSIGTNAPQDTRSARQERQCYERDQALFAWQRGNALGAEGDAAGMRQWLERAWRLIPTDPNLAFALAGARMACGDVQGARRLFASLAETADVPEVLAGLSACALRLGNVEAAVAACGRALARCAASATLSALASHVVAAAGLTGWCGLTEDGRLLTSADQVAVTLDSVGVPLLGAGKLGAGWERARELRVSVAGRDLLGSPVDIQAIRRIEGFVRLGANGIEGWVSQPAAPWVDPEVFVSEGGRTRRVVATDQSAEAPGQSPVARPRGFACRVSAGGAVSVRDRDGRDLWGSPLTANPAPPPRAARPSGRPGVCVIVPVYRGEADTLSCLASVRRTISAADELVVVNDASPEPALADALRGMARLGEITLLDANPGEPARNVGFPRAANAGLRHAAGRDAVLLNADTVVFPGWLNALQAAARAAPDIGTATPFSNDASIFSYPRSDAASPMPDQAQGAALAAMARTAWRKGPVEVPTGHGFCLYITAQCLHRTGLLREDVFAQGYGEENDFCERARAKGFRHVAVPAVFVAHRGGVSFGAARLSLLARNAGILEALHPDYHGRVMAFIAADTLAVARRALDEARWRAMAKAASGAVLLITHGLPGGTTRVVRERASAAREEGLLPVVLRGVDGVSAIGLGEEDDYPNLFYRLPEELPSLLRLLRVVPVARAELHHLNGHDFSVTRLLERFGVPYAVFVHDYGWMCPRLSFVTGDGRFCGEAPVEECVRCIAAWGEAMEPPVDAATLRTRSARLMAAAASVVAPSADVAARVSRHFPGAKMVVRPWEVDAPAQRARAPARSRLRVALAGAIGMEKGYFRLVECARDAAARGLPLEFWVVGYSHDDTPLIATGHAFVTGPFRAEEAESMLRDSGAAIGFLPSVWPETWCYALTDLWRAGLDVAVFDIGTPAARVRATGRGWVLPLNLPAAAVNDALLNLQGVAVRS
jgi:GT2 family glycosyltransferase/glycosyltransferase involved in cell wall biosynthesis